MLKLTVVPVSGTVDASLASTVKANSCISLDCISTYIPCTCYPTEPLKKCSAEYKFNVQDTVHGVLRIVCLFHTCQVIMIQVSWDVCQPF